MFMRNLSDLDADMTKMKVCWLQKHLLKWRDSSLMWQMLNLIENLEILGVLSLPNFKSLYEWSSAILELQESHKFASELLSANQICDRLKTVFEADKPMLSKLHKWLLFEVLELTSFQATMLILQSRTSKAARRIKVSNLQKLRGVKTMKGCHMNFSCEALHSNPDFSGIEEASKTLDIAQESGKNQRDGSSSGQDDKDKSNIRSTL
ncbi:hypothetical protein Q3G72_018036 [Acer saccharum]|nr:hypothetical protein Q3G72_018036 [Acer saccharum]